MNFQRRTVFLNAVSMLIFGSLILALTSCKGTEPKEETTVEKPMANGVQLTPEEVQAAHITTTTVQSQLESLPYTSTAVVKANENRLFHINSFVSGRVIQDNAALGDTIHAGQTLAVVQNLDVVKIQATYIHELHTNEIEIAQAKTRYSLAQSKQAREQRLLNEGISPQKDYQQAKAETDLARTDLAGKLEHRTHLKNEAQALLSAYGIKPNSGHAERINSSSPIISPKGGVVLKKTITLGDMVTPDTVMYEVADLSQIWLDISVFPKDIERIHPGQSITFITDSLPGKIFYGKIDYVQPAIQENSQTYIARAYLQNPDLLLKPGVFGQAHVDRHLSRALTVVPESAIQRYGRETFVFIPQDRTHFRKQTIVLGEKMQNGYTVQSGISPGMTVIANGSFTLKAELLKSLFEQSE